jgi:beta-glucosidase
MLYMSSNNGRSYNSQVALKRAKELLRTMSLDEKLGQLNQVSGEGGNISEARVCAIQEGRVSSVINEVDINIVNELQRIAIEESRLGIPLLIGRDVIHGFKTIFPIPLGQAASWCEDVVKQGARMAAVEAASQGVNWTFAPMLDITRDPRWGRIAESLGEDPYLCSRLGVAMVEGFQSNNLGNKNAIAACAKHFAGYGYTESGRDYSFANISENELRNTVLPPFKAVAEAGVATFMSSFSDLNGVPASGNKWLMQHVLRDEWQYKGFVVSDWASIPELHVHGIAEDHKHCAELSLNAGIDMEMASECYAHHLPELLGQQKIELSQIDAMVLRIIALKYELGLFDSPFTDPNDFPPLVNKAHLAQAKNAVIKSCVLLQNKHNVLPLNKDELDNIAIIGPLADDGYEQLGTWIFDGDEQHSVTCLSAISGAVNNATQVHFAKGLSTSRDHDHTLFNEAKEAASKAETVIMILGEESILSGEAHSRTNLNLPGAQIALIEQIASIGKSIILVIMAGRPLTLAPILDKVDAILYAWHPGTMGGEAISDLIFGNAVPSGKLPVTFPRVVGQIPIYYGQKHGGRPATEHTYVHQDDIAVRAAQTSLGMVSTHLDTHFTPQFPFGFGLSYANFEYSDVHLSSNLLQRNEYITATVTITNNSHIDAQEIVQLYIRDKVASTTRPVKELKGFKRILISANTSQEVSFEITPEDLYFYGLQNTLELENGEFHVWIGADSNAQSFAVFNLID